ncbi:NAD-dependent epimerase/dehydratase family protein [Rhizobium sp. BK602]|uniref:NAD-dependent epimerase/dehydratase family protein n=1 Tax=Rhizobium sp. BK602 TaxID=2586986 RepID=UPI001610AD78|nr:NAD-dependent epimerase/dehydratase family protein [Rhizobium sp. BK602]MBB3612593.1 dTDP-L-rhamnose 4-epimerase [Rhizobium sp. BK602]
MLRLVKKPEEILRILVTGGAGFIGSYFVRRLEMSAENEILVYDNLHPQVHGNEAVPPIFGPKVEFIRGDVRDASLLRETIKRFRPNAIAHLASETGTGQSHDEISRYADVNIMGTTYLFEGIRAMGRELDWFLLTSSRAVYGEGAYINSQHRLMANVVRRLGDLEAGRFGVYDSNGLELTSIPSSSIITPTPLSVYAATKLTQEHLARSILSTSNARLLIYRFQNVFGAGQSLINPYTGVLSIFISRLLQGKPIGIYEDGEVSRDFIYVDDVVAAMIAGISRDVRPERPLDIGSGNASKIYDVAIKLARLAGYEGFDLPITGEFRPGDIRHAVADTSYSRSVLEWSPKVSLEEGLERLYVWAKDRISFPS